MTNEEAKEILSKINIAVSCGATPILSENQIIEATNVAIKALEQQPCKDWLSTFNTESATACYTAVQRLKESVNDRLDEGYKG